MPELTRSAPQPPGGGAPPPALSARDLELLHHLAAGESAGQAATAMRVSRNTLRTRLRRVQGKVGAVDRQHIVHRSRELGLV